MWGGGVIRERVLRIEVFLRDGEVRLGGALLFVRCLYWVGVEGI